MGLIRAAIDAAGGTLGDQWQDFYSVPDRLPPTAAMFAAVPRGTNAGRGSNIHGSYGVITNGSQIVVPEGYSLVLMEEGGITGVVTEPGAFAWYTDAPDSRSVFAGEGFKDSVLNTSWERFKLGGRPKAQQQAFFVSMKELPNNRFGTTGAVYWDDSYLNAQVGAIARGTYTIRITDPILFIRNWLPAKYLQANEVFDFTDPRNDAAQQLFHEVVSSLAQALATYTNDPGHGSRMAHIQQDIVGFGRSLSEAVEAGYGWRSDRGLEIVSTAILGIEYDEPTRELLKTVQRADALQGVRGNSNLQASVAQGLQDAGAVDGSSGLFGMALASGATTAGLQQPDPRSSDATGSGSPPEGNDDAVSKLTRAKELLDAGLITEADYDAVKARVLGI